MRAPARVIVARPRPTRLRDRAPYIERRMAGATGTVQLHYRDGRLMGVSFPGPYEDADELPVERTE